MSNMVVGVNCREDVDIDLLIARGRAVGGFKALLVQAGPEYLPQIARLREVAEMVIWRTHHDDALFAIAPDAQAWVDQRRAEMMAYGINPGSIWLHLHNEAGVSREVVDWERVAISYGVNFYGMRFVALNPSVGGPEPEGIEVARPVLEVANNHAQNVVIGLHEYFYVLHNAYNEAFVWHVGRIKNWLAYCQVNGLHNVRFGITEAGPDNLMDVNWREPGRWPRTIAPDGIVFNELRGYRTLDAAYRQEFGDEYDALGLGGLVAREVRRAWDSAWAGRAAFALFFGVGRKYSSGWHGAAPWHQFDVGDDAQFWGYLAAWADEAGNGGPPPVRETADYMTAVSLHKRTGPGTGYATVQLLSANTLVTVFTDAAETADGYVWYQRADDGFWMAAHKADGSSVYLVPVEKPEPEPEPDYEALRGMLATAVALIEDVRKAL